MDEDVKKLLEENLQLTRNLQESVGKINSYLKWQRVFSTIYFVLVVAPLILAVIYLPPLIRPYIEQYQQLFQDYQSTRDQGASFDEEIRNFLNQSR